MCKERIKYLKVEADFSADPLWCNKCYGNLELDDFPLSKTLKTELLEWVAAYGTWIEWETDGIVAGGVIMEAQHNVRGAELTKQVKRELEGQYEVVFSPSTFAKRHSEI